ncbi:MAG: hypothetical protein ACM3X4_09545 [Ignavibacteriales bacterium]
MRLGIELVSLCDLLIPPGSHFEARVIVNGAVQENTAGRDEYRTAAAIKAGHRLVATGRLNIWDSGLSPAYVLRVRPAYLVHVAIRPRDRIGFLLRTSIPFSQGEIQGTTAVRIVGESGRSHGELALSRPGVTVDWEGRGRFRVDLGVWPVFGVRKGGEPR